MAVKIILRHDTVANWESYNPVLTLGEVGVETDTLNIKVGDGSSAWGDLSYASASPATVQAMIDAAVGGILDFAPGALDTLNELAAAINDDPNFFSTIATNISSAITTANEYTDTGLALKANINSPTFTGTVSGITKSMVGLGNVDNTTDANKPISTATQTALNAKAATSELSAHETATTSVHGITDTNELETKTGAQNRANTAETNANNYTDGEITTLTNTFDGHADATTNVHGIADTSALESKTGAQSKADTAESNAAIYTDTAIAALVSSAPSTLDALNELAAALGNDPNFATSIATTLGEKLNFVADTAANFASNNIVCALDTLYIEVNDGLGRAKLGNGVDHYNDLLYVGEYFALDLVNLHNLAEENVHGISNTVNLAYLTDVSAVAGDLTTHAEATTNVHGIANTADLVTTSDLSAHATDTTNIHGIANTADLVTTSDLSSAISTHASVTTNVHGIADTSNLVTYNDLNTHSTDTTSVHGIANTADLITTSDLDAHAGTTSNVHGIVNAADIVYTNDVVGVYAPLSSPEFSGSVVLPTDTTIGLVSASAIGTLENVTSDIQAQIDGKLSSSVASSTYAPLHDPTFTGTVSLPADTSISGVSAIEIGYLTNVTSDVQTQLDSKAPIANPTFTGTVSGITKGMVGLGSVNNTSDIDKPISSATQTALDAKASTTDLSTHASDTTNIHGIADTAALETQTGAQTKADAAETAANDYTDTQIGALTTGNITEGLNLYFTDERAQDAVGNSVGAGLTYTDSTGAIGVQTNYTGGGGITVDSFNALVIDTDVVVTKSDTQTLTNKTLNSAILSGDTTVTSTTESTSTTSGALVVDGGLGIAGNLNAGGVSYFGEPTDLALTNPVAFYTKDVNDYIQIGIQNPNAGDSASADVVITADNGTNTTHYVDLGIASSGYDYPDFNMIQPNDAYLIVEGGDLILNASSGGKAIDFYVGGTTETDEVGSWNEAALSVANELHVTGATTLSSTLDVTGAVTAHDIDVASHLNYTPIAGSSTPTWSEGNLYYDSEEKTLILQGSGSGNFEIAMGQREWVRTRNTSGATIPKGTPVYVTGVHIPGDPTHGHHPTIAPAIASDKAKRDVIGITGESIANGAHGYTVVRGYIEGIDTSNLTSGARVHLSADVLGGISTAAPDYPNYPVDLGICLTSSSTVGTLYVHINSHAFERFRVDEGAYIDGSLTVAGDFTILGNQSSVAVTNLSVDNNFIYLNSGDSIGALNTTFSGTGVNDAILHGHYTGTTTKTFKVKIVVNGTGSNPDSFRWSTDNFATDNGSDIQITAGTRFDLSDGISVAFVSDNGHILNDVWSGTAAPTAVDIALIGNRNTGSSGPGYTHLGMFYDVSDDKFKFFSEYDPEPEGNINISDTSFVYGVVKAATFEGNLTGTVTGSVSGNAGTVTNGVYTTDTGTVTNGMLAGSITDSKLSTISTAGKVSNSATTATNANTANAIVARDASGNFTAGVITAALSGNADTATNATNATNATKSAITEDTTTNGSKYLTWVDANTGNNPVKTTSTKLTFNPSTGVVSATGFSGALTGNVTGNVSGNAGTVTNGVYTTDTGTVTSAMIANGTIVNADINDSAAIAATKISGTAVTQADTGTVTSAMIADGTIVNGDISSSAAIAVSKLAANTISGKTLGNNLDALTIGTGLSGTSYNGSSAVTVAIDSTVATLTGTQALTNKTVTFAAGGATFSDGTVQVTAGVPSLTTIKSELSTSVALSALTSPLTYRDALAPLTGAVDITIDADGTNGITFPIGTSIDFYQVSGTGAKFVQGSGVTLQYTPGLKFRTTFSSATITKVAANTWLVFGDLSA